MVILNNFSMKIKNDIIDYMIKLDTLIINPDNPRSISPQALEKLADSIKRDPEFMVLRPIVVDENNMILGGNRRKEACAYLGKVEIPDEWVKQIKGLTQKKKNRFIAIDNSPEGISGIWDYEMLQEIFDETELEELGFDEGLDDFEDIDFDNIKSTEDRSVKDKDMDVTCPECNNRFTIKI